VSRQVTEKTQRTAAEAGTQEVRRRESLEVSPEVRLLEKRRVSEDEEIAPHHT